tara:strand:+ start:660 stop:1571 length:912 start_codon:yes stop_codon:yes gene_type:complete
MIVGRGFFSGSANRNDRLAAGFSGYSTEDKKNVINFQKKLQNDPTYTPKPYERESLNKQMRAEDSPRLDRTKIASADTGGLSEDENYKAYMKLQGIRYPRTLSDMFHNLNRGNMRQDIKEGKYKDGQYYKEGSLLNQAKPEGNPFTRFAGSVFDAVTGTQPAAANVLDGKIDFGSAVRGIGNLPSDYKATEAAAFSAAEKFRDTASGMSNLPSDYKSTEAAAFKKAQNFRRQEAEDKKIQGIIDRNPRLTRGTDGSVKAVQKTRAEAGTSARTAAGNRARVKANAKAKAKAAALNRRKKKNKK